MEKKSAAAIVPLFAAVLLAMAVATPARAGVPVYDGSNFAQQLIQIAKAVQQVEALEKQLTTMGKQLTQLEAQTTELQAQTPELQQQTKYDSTNTDLKADYIWGEAKGIFNSLDTITGEVEGLTSKTSDIKDYLEKFGDVDYYSDSNNTGSKCLTGEGECTDVDWAELRKRQADSIKSQKQANDALFNTLKEQMNGIKEDTAALDELQGRAATAEGQMQALGYANQLASAQVKQLMQIRSLMVVQQEAFAVMMANNNDKAAREIVSDKKMTGTEMKYEAPKKTGWVWSDDGALRRN